MERAVGELDAVFGGPWLIAMAGQDRTGDVECLAGAARTAFCGNRRLADLSPAPGSGPIELLNDRCPAGVGGGDRVCHQATGELILTAGQRDGDVGGRAAVELGGSAGAGTAPAGEAGELGDEQAFLLELVEVELGLVDSHTDGRGRLVTAHGVGLGAHVEIEVPADGLGKSPDARDPLGEVLHGRSISKRHNS